MLQDANPFNIEADIIQTSMAREINDILSTLEPREAAILRMRYGLADSKELTLEVVGQSLHVTRERIRQIESKALRKLRTLNKTSVHRSLEEYGDEDCMHAEMGSPGM